MKCRVTVSRDECPESPRDWCCVGKMLCWHPRYNLGDEHNYNADSWQYELACEFDPYVEDKIDIIHREGYDSWFEKASEEGYECPRSYANSQVSKYCERCIEKALDANCIMLPLYLYDHSGLAINTSGFGCSWDSGQCGVIVCTKETIDKEFNGDTECAKGALKNEVETYNQYLNGDIWGFSVEEFKDGKWEIIDSCCGFYGSDPETNGMKDYLPDDCTFQGVEHAG